MKKRFTQRHSGHNGTEGGKEKDMRSEVCSLNVVYTNKFDDNTLFFPPCLCAAV
jgi:hypothetical protein